MKRYIFLLLLLPAFNISAATVLPQLESSGEDGLYSLSTDDLLFTDPDNIYNFTDFAIFDTASLSILNNSPVYIYSQQSITISGSIIADTPELNFIAPEITISGGLSTSGNLVFYANNASFSGSTATSTSTGSATLTTGSVNLVDGSVSLGNELTLLDNPVLLSGDLTVIDSGTSGSIVITDITPVPLPAATWLFISGLLSLFFARRKTIA